MRICDRIKKNKRLELNTIDTNDKKFALLIDADNVSPKYIKNVLEEISVYGTVTYKRMYADWTNTAKQGWKTVALEHSINPIQQYSYTTGKNSSDSALIIDAMDILYTGSVDGFCLVSSDSDFTKLAQRLREAGKYVLGMGEQKTPRPFRTACDAFKILEVIAEDSSVVERGSSAAKPATRGAKKKDDGDDTSITSIDEIKSVIHKILNDNSNKGRFTNISEIGDILSKTYSDFDVRNYGCSKLNTFLEGLEDFAVNKFESGYRISPKNAAVSRESIEAFISELLKQNDGHIDNLSLVNDELKKKFPEFSVKQYGFSRFSSFIGSFATFGVVGNSVRAKRTSGNVD